MRLTIRAAVAISCVCVLAAGCGGDTAGGPPTAAPAPAPAPVDPAQAKQLLLDFFNFQGTRQERADQVMTPDYVQHNPRFLRMDALTGARGSQAWVAAGERASQIGIRLVALGGIRLRAPIILMADADLVTAIYRGNLPMPDDPTRTYEAYAFETFRVRDGRVSEHWDQVRLATGWMEPGTEPGPPGLPQPDPVAQPSPMPGCTSDRDGFGQVRAMAVAAVALATEADERLALLGDGFVSHSPAVITEAENGGLDPRAAFVQAIANGRAGSGGGALAPRTADLVMVECDYVTVVWRQETADPDDASRTYEAFTFDTFRLEDGRIAEHWDSTTRS